MNPEKQRQILKEWREILIYCGLHYIDPDNYRWCIPYLPWVFRYANDKGMEENMAIRLTQSNDMRPPDQFENLLIFKQAIEKERYKAMRKHQSIIHLASQTMNNLTQILYLFKTS
eukprot:UN01893